MCTLEDIIEKTRKKNKYYLQVTCPKRYGVLSNKCMAF